MKQNSGNTIIESLGAYLPPKAVTTRQVVADCVNEVRFPIERITGIKERRMAGDTEFAMDLAIKAVEDCFKYSKYTPKDIDLVISCNISHYDQHDRYSFEPSGAIRLHERFGFDNATVYDISNACAGVFTGINIADAYIKAGNANRVLIVSGEYITHLTKTAQKEIVDLYDLRLACLTLGDSGVAVILERSEREDLGFQKLELLTLGDYSAFCVAKATEYPHGGAIMLTHSADLSGVAVKEGAKHCLKIVGPVGLDAIDTVISHQTSKISIQTGINEFNKILNSNKFNEENTIINLEKRGNTSTTSHFVALMDNIQSGRLKAGERIMFSINASGITLGTAIYNFDDLPDRIRQYQETGTKAKKLSPTSVSAAPAHKPRIRIGSIGLVPKGIDIKKSSFDLAKYAAKECFQQSGVTGEDIDMLLFTGVYRDEFLCEPAVAAMIAGDLKFRSDGVRQDERNTFAFDVLNGSLGFLNAIQTGINLIHGGKAENAIILTSEIENNRDLWPDHLLEIEETGSGMIIQKSDDGTGFGDFAYQKFTQYSNKRLAESMWIAGKPMLELVADEGMNDLYIECIVSAVREWEKEGLIDLNKITKFFLPQISSSFIQKLANALLLPPEKVVDAVDGRKDLYTSSIPYAIQEAIRSGGVQKGDTGLILSVGSGILVGCAHYYF